MDSGFARKIEIPLKHLIDERATNYFIFERNCICLNFSKK